MSNRDYSPTKLSSLIHSDADVGRYQNLFRRYCLALKLMLPVPLITLLIIFIISFTMAWTPNTTLNIVSSPVLNTLSLAGFCAVWLLVSFFGIYYLRVNIAALEPVSGTSRCVDIEYLILKSPVANSIRDNVLKQGRRLYNFDADLMEDTIENTNAPISVTMINDACRRIHGINNNV